MTAKTIRDRFEEMRKERTGIFTAENHVAYWATAQAFFLMEIAAQLAELNERQPVSKPQIIEVTVSPNNGQEG